MQEIDADTISRVMQQLGSKKTEKKTQSAIDNLTEGRKRLQDPDVRALLSQKQKERRERERQEKAALGLIPAATEKKAAGRPRKAPSENVTEKRGRGRPKKQTGEPTA